MKWLWYCFLALVSVGMLGAIVAVAGVVYALSYFSQDLPDYSALKDYQPPVVTRVYAGDGQLMSEFAQEKRVFVPIEVIPPLLKNAFIAAEDQNFYEHSGVDYFAIGRAIVSNLKNIGSGRRPVGASTITQQVAKNFLLTNEVSYTRKIREALLSYRMERALSKDRLLELYLNEIYLGEGTYGVAAAALNYFGKPLEDLEIEQVAFLAALPKAPNNYHPVRRHDAALARRNWVIGRMTEDGYITREQAEIARAKPLLQSDNPETGTVNAPYFAEEIRRTLREKYGEQSLYQGGLVVRSSIDPRLQAIAERTLRDGLVAYDKRHGYRGPLGKIKTMSAWQAELTDWRRPDSMPPGWRLAVVRTVTAQDATIGFTDGSEGKLLLPYVKWARKKGVGSVTAVTQVVEAGDVIMVDEVEEDGQTVLGLRQIPAVNGSLIAMDPHTGRVLAMQGGWSYEASEFNRATQALRQPGSSFKPLVYLTALEKGFTPATLVLDASFVSSQGPGLKEWRPTNYSNEFYGPTPIRVGIEKSRNLMTVRLADYLGMPAIIDTVQKFGVSDNMKPHLANSLGAGETTLLRMTTAYAQMVNGGKKIDPTFIDRIQDRRGATIFSRDKRSCAGCGPLIEWSNQPVPAIPDERAQLADPRHVYQMVSMMEGVVERGTAVRAKALKRPLAGKTGTTNDSRDTWFIGFSPDMVVGVFIGFDEPKNMGKKETGSSVALPVWINFMHDALADTPAVPFRVPPGIRHVQINAETGARARPGDRHVIWEAFTTGTEPTDKMYILDNNGIHLYSGGFGNAYGGTAGAYGGSYDGAYDGAYGGTYDGAYNPDAAYGSSGSYVPPSAQTGGTNESATTGTGGLY